MKAITFTPAVCQPSQITVTEKNADGQDAIVVKQVPPAYEGTVTMRMPTYGERLSLYEDVPDLPEKATEKQKQKRNVAVMVSVAEKAASFVDVVQLRRVEDGHEFTSYADLQYDTDMHEVVNEIVGKLVGKYAVTKLGNEQPTT